MLPDLDVLIEIFAFLDRKSLESVVAPASRRLASILRRCLTRAPYHVVRELFVDFGNPKHEVLINPLQPLKTYNGGFNDSDSPWLYTKNFRFESSDWWTTNCHRLSGEEFEKILPRETTPPYFRVIFASFNCRAGTTWRTKRAIRKLRPAWADFEPAAVELSVRGLGKKTQQNVIGVVQSPTLFLVTDMHPGIFFDGAALRRCRDVNVSGSTWCNKPENLQLIVDWLHADTQTENGRPRTLRISLDGAGTTLERMIVEAFENDTVTREYEATFDFAWSKIRGSWHTREVLRDRIEHERDGEALTIHHNFSDRHGKNQYSIIHFHRHLKEQKTNEKPWKITSSNEPREFEVDDDPIITFFSQFPETIHPRKPPTNGMMPGAMPGIMHGMVPGMISTPWMMPGMMPGAMFGMMSGPGIMNGQGMMSGAMPGLPNHPPFHANGRENLQMKLHRKIMMSGQGMMSGGGLTSGLGMMNGQGIMNGSGMMPGSGMMSGSGMMASQGMMNTSGMPAGHSVLQSLLLNNRGIPINGQGMTPGSGMMSGSGMMPGWGMMSGSGIINPNGASAGQSVLAQDVTSGMTSRTSTAFGPGIANGPATMLNSGSMNHSASDGLSLTNAQESSNREEAKFRPGINQKITKTTNDATSQTELIHATETEFDADVKPNRQCTKRFVKIEAPEPEDFDKASTPECSTVTEKRRKLDEF